MDPSARLPLSQGCLSAMLSHSAQGWRDLDDSCEHDWLQAGPASRSENAASSTQAQGTPCPFHPLGKAQGGHGPHQHRGKDTEPLIQMTSSKVTQPSAWAVLPPTITSLLRHTRCLSYLPPTWKTLRRAGTLVQNLLRLLNS